VLGGGAAGWWGRRLDHEWQEGGGRGQRGRSQRGRREVEQHNASEKKPRKSQHLDGSYGEEERHRERGRTCDR
jgi:hypothetical protein